MRIRNKELRNRWHRKEQRIKELVKEAIQAKGDRPKAADKPAKPKAAPKKTAVAKAESAEKPKRPPKKKEETAAEASE